MDKSATSKNQNTRLLIALLGLSVVFLLVGIVMVYYFAAKDKNVPEKIATNATPTAVPSVMPTIPPFPPPGLSKEELQELLSPYVKHVITISESGLSVDSITASVGDRVKWVNNTTQDYELSFMGVTNRLDANGGEVMLLLDSAGEFAFEIVGLKDGNGTITVANNE